MNTLVSINQNKATTTSRLIAEAFDREHKNILRDINNLECSAEFTELNFEPSAYKDGSGRMLPAYNITRDGFVWLAMGFTGKKAAEFKEKFITAFNTMEKALLEGQGAIKRYEFNHNRRAASPGGIDSRSLAKLIADPDPLKLRIYAWASDRQVPDDLLRDVEERWQKGKELPPGKDSELLASYLFGLLKIGGGFSGVEIGTDKEGRAFILAQTSDLLKGMKKAESDLRLPKIQDSPAGLGGKLTRYSSQLENLGWRRHLERIVSGQRFYKYTCLEVAN